MEPLSGAASVIAVFQLSSKVVEYINSAWGATKKGRSLRREVQACESILEQLIDEADESEEGRAWSDTVRALEAPEAPLGRLSAALRQIKDRLQPQQGVKKALAVLAWPFNEKEIKEVFATIEREKSLLELALTNNSRKLLQEIKRTSRENEQQLERLMQAMRVTSNDTQAQLKDGLTTMQRSQAGLHDGVDRLHRRYDNHQGLEERSAILRWLSQEDYGAIHSGFLSRRQAGTGQWLLKSSEFQNWLECKGETLFCPGIPGAGKTILAATVVDELLSRFPDDGDVGVAYVYCDFNRQKEQSPGSLLASILRQLAQGRSSLPDCLKSLHDKHKQRRTQPTYEEISATLHSTIGFYSRVFVVIDALDECQLAGNHRHKFLSSILKVQAECGISLFATSRPIPAIVDAFSQRTALEVLASEEDVRKFLEGNMEGLPEFVRRSSELQELVKSTIVEAVDGMFLLAKFHLDSLCGKISVKALRKTLENLPTGSEAYASVYDSAMKRIESQLHDQEELAKKVLSWITRAARQLKVTELQDALAVEAGTAALDQENRPPPEDMVSLCAGLVTIDKETNIIRLIHYTTQEYFSRTSEQWFPDAEAEITKICCTYLSFETFLSGPCKGFTEYGERLKQNILFGYAAQNWGLHASKSRDSHEEIVRFLRSVPNVEATCQALFDSRHHNIIDDGVYYTYPAQFRGLHMAAYFGLEYAASILLKDQTFPVEDGRSQNSLRPSASNGRAHVVKPSLQAGYVDPDLADGYGRTPLAWAARNGKKAVAILLLADGRVDPDKKDNDGQTPLALAAKRGCTSVAELLLASRKVDPNSKDTRGETPLARAAENGHTSIVELLLDTGLVDPDPTTENGLTPLALAARNGHIAVMEILLATKRVNVSSKTVHLGYPLRGSRTPLSWAAEAGHVGAVMLLLEASLADVDLKDSDGITPLSYAAHGGHERTFELLLATERVDVDSKSSGPWVRGRTPLSFAAEGSSISFAAQSGHDSIVKLLLDTGRVDIDSLSTGDYALCLPPSYRLDPDLDEVAASESVGRTPLSWAAEAGRETAVQLLLGRGANINLADIKGWTPLLWAYSRGHAAVVELLLATPGARADQEALGCYANRDKPFPEIDEVEFTKGRNALSLTAEGGHVAMVTTLLSQGFHVDSQDQQGRTPLSWASMNGNLDVVCQLIKAGAEVDLPDKKHRTPLSYSAEHGHLATVELLLGDGARVESRDTRRTPLSYAADSEYYNDTAVIILLENGAEVNSKDKDGWTPLLHAVTKWDNEDVVEFLIAKHADVHWKDNEGRTALSLATEHDNGPMVDLLLEAGAGSQPDVK